MNNRERKNAAIMTARLMKFKFRKMLEFLRKMAPALMYVGNGAKRGMRLAIINGIENRSTNLRFERYVWNESERTFPIVKPLINKRKNLLKLVKVYGKEETLP
jgi:hypothetical protein